ncbi:MAG: CinA-like protein [Chlamydiales bacterium]|nr:CinA-like protein [Chlamydiales bacterium]
MLEQQIHHQLIKTSGSLALAESCTGGGIASRFVALPDCSLYFQGSVVAYSNHAKEQLLGVQPRTIENCGAVSEETACEMASGALQKFKSRFALATTGVAGPAGGTAQKPVGTVCFALVSVEKEQQMWTSHFKGERVSVIEQAIQEALEHLWSYIS